MEVERLKSYLCRLAKWYFDSDYLDKLNDEDLCWYLEVMRELYDGVPLTASAVDVRRESYTRKNRMRRSGVGQALVSACREMSAGGVAADIPFAPTPFVNSA